MSDHDSTTRPGSVLGEVLRSRHVPRLLTASLVGRLPTGMAAVAILLYVREHGGDYRLAGLLTALYAGSAAACGPVASRLIDRTRQPPLLLVSALASSVAFVVFGVVDPVTQPAFAISAAVVAGAATPQLEPCLRVLWEHLVSGDRAVRAAFLLDAATQELIFVTGPLVVLGAIAVAGPAAGLLCAGLLGLAGTLWFATARPSRVWRSAPTPAHWAGPLRSVGVVRLLACLVCVGGTLGAFTVGITGYAEAEGARGAAGWLIALNAAGALVGGVAYTTSRPARREDRRLRNLLGFLALGYLPLMLTPGIPWMSPLAFLSGCALPMVLAAMFAVVAGIAPAGTITEAHAWMITSFGVGSAAGSAVAGLILDSHAATWTFVLAAGCACAGILPALAPLLRDRAS